MKKWIIKSGVSEIMITCAAGGALLSNYFGTSMTIGIIGAIVGAIIGFFTCVRIPKNK